MNRTRPKKRRRTIAAHRAEHRRREAQVKQLADTVNQLAEQLANVTEQLRDLVNWLEAVSGTERPPWID